MPKTFRVRDYGPAVSNRTLARLILASFLVAAAAPALSQFPAAPDLSQVPMLPDSGPAAGGTQVTISVPSLDEPQCPCFVWIGGVAATNVYKRSYAIRATTPALSPGTLNDLEAVSIPPGPFTRPAAWMADFLDVPEGDIFHDFVERLLRNGVTAGCGAGKFCVNDPIRRDQMAPLLLKARVRGAPYTPPPCTPPGLFVDVACPGPFTDWVEQLAAEGIAVGCGSGGYCPNGPVRRDQAAVLLLKARHGASYAPPPCAGVFDDVPCPSPFADWVEQLTAEGIAGGCADGLYCPESPVTRGHLAIFLVYGFGLP